jgi:adenine-specific DNA-methyltransferase
LVELIWDRKYDKSGDKSAPVRVALPFQTIETLNESSQQRQKSIESFLTGRGEIEWRNRLIWGDKKYVLPSLLPEFADSVDLVYIDPPFDTGADFSYHVEVPDHGVESASFTKLPSVIEQKAYRDTWGEDPTQLDSYVRWFYETLILLDELLKPSASIYIHLDWHIAHYVKVLADEIFGKENFQNEIVWKRALTHNDPKGYGRIHDTLLFYKKPLADFSTPYAEYDKEYVDRAYRLHEKDGRRYQLLPLHATHEFSSTDTNTRRFGDKTLRPPPGKYWRWSQKKIDEAMKAKLIVVSETGIPRYKKYLDEAKGVPPQSIWDDLKQLTREEMCGYPTQKPKQLLERILEASSKQGDLILDCFCGSGTTAVVAEKKGRRWIVCDLSRFAIHTTRKRLLGVGGVKPFVIQNLGKYERQAWQAAEFGDQAGTKISAYVNFILNLYHAQPLHGYVWLHGKKGNRLVHVGSVDSPISPLDIGQIVAEFRRVVGTGKDAPRTNGVDVLGWDFAFELNELAKQQAAQANVDVRFLRIPREVLDKRAVEQGDVHFFELASLDVGMKSSGMKVTVTIKDFVIPADDVPTDVQKEIKHWAQWIDYWAVDWNYKNDTFHNEWQEYRTREKPELVTESSKTYDEHGEYRIVVKVIDILGNDTTKILPVKV